MRRLALCFLIVVAATGCSEGTAPPLEVSGVEVFAPLPGSRMSVAYLMLKNNTREPIVLRGIDSPQFRTVSMHETRIEDGIARMQALPALTIPAGRTISLSEGAAHLMLADPVGSLALGQPLELRLHYDAHGLVIVHSSLQPRLGADVSR